MLTGRRSYPVYTTSLLERRKVGIHVRSPHEESEGIFTVCTEGFLEIMYCNISEMKYCRIKRIKKLYCFKQIWILLSFKVREISRLSHVASFAFASFQHWRISKMPLRQMRQDAENVGVSQLWVTLQNDPQVTLFEFCWKMHWMLCRCLTQRESKFSNLKLNICGMLKRQQMKNSFRLEFNIKALCTSMFDSWKRNHKRLWHCSTKVYY